MIGYFVIERLWYWVGQLAGDRSRLYYYRWLSIVVKRSLLEEIYFVWSLSICIPFSHLRLRLRFGFPIQGSQDSPERSRQCSVGNFDFSPKGKVNSPEEASWLTPRYTSRPPRVRLCLSGGRGGPDDEKRTRFRNHEQTDLVDLCTNYFSNSIEIHRWH